MSKKALSHVYIPKGLLKLFTDTGKKNGWLYYIDFNKGVVNKCHPKSFNTIEAFFTPANEELLSKTYESATVLLIEKIEKYARSKNHEIILKSTEQSCIFRFLTMQLIRDNLIFRQADNDKYEKEHPFSALSDNKTAAIKEIRELIRNGTSRHSKNVLVTAESLSGVLTNEISQEMWPEFIYNDTNVPFLFTNRPYTFNYDSDNEYLMNMVLSPSVLAVFHKRTPNLSSCAIENLTDGELVKSFNMKLLLSAKTIPPYILIGDISELKRVSGFKGKGYI